MNVHAGLYMAVYFAYFIIYPSNRLLYAAIPSHDEATDIFFCGEEVYFTPT